MAVRGAKGEEGWKPREEEGKDHDELMMSLHEGFSSENSCERFTHREGQMMIQPLLMVMMTLMIVIVNFAGEEEWRRCLFAKVNSS